MRASNSDRLQRSQLGQDQQLGNWPGAGFLFYARAYSAKDSQLSTGGSCDRRSIRLFVVGNGASRKVTDESVTLHSIGPAKISGFFASVVLRGCQDIAEAPLRGVVR